MEEWQEYLCSAWISGEEGEWLKTKSWLVPGCPQEGKQEHICAMRNSPAENFESFRCLQKLHQRGKTLEDSVCAGETTGEKNPPIHPFGHAPSD